MQALEASHIGGGPARRPLGVHDRTDSNQQLQPPLTAQIDETGEISGRMRSADEIEVAGRDLVEVPAYEGGDEPQPAVVDHIEDSGPEQARIAPVVKLAGDQGMKLPIDPQPLLIELHFRVQRAVFNHGNVPPSA